MGSDISKPAQVIKETTSKILYPNGDLFEGKVPNNEKEEF